MATLDRIRLTGLLTKSPAQSGLFYAPATRLAVALPSRQPLGGLSEPLGPSARPAPLRLCRQRPEPRQDRTSGRGRPQAPRSPASGRTVPLTVRSCPKDGVARDLPPPAPQAGAQPVRLLDDAGRER